MSQELKSLFSAKFKEITSQLPHDCNLLIVSKNRTLKEIQIYYELGQRDFGENKVQELQDKAESLKEICPEIRWHMIGHLQSNKINQLLKVPHLFAIHSVHSHELLDKLIKAQDKLSHSIHLFLQFNSSKEAEKSGFETYTDLLSAAEKIKSSTTLKLTGLMTMGTIRTDNFERDAGRCFQDLNVEKEKLQSELGVKLKTSMGMSQDWKIALRENSNWIRLGTSMFEA